MYPKAPKKLLSVHHPTMSTQYPQGPKAETKALACGEPTKAALKALIASGSPYSALLRIHHGSARSRNGTNTRRSALTFGFKPGSLRSAGLGESQIASAIVGKSASAEVLVSIAKPARTPTNRADFTVQPVRTAPRERATVQVQSK